MNRLVLSLAVTTILCAASGSANASELNNDNAGKWLARARAIAVLPQEDASIKPIHGDVGLNNSYVPELDFSYFFTNNIAAELILATSNHNAKAQHTAAGNLDLGNVMVLPPTLTLQYHFVNESNFKPYIGAGVNYTHFYDVNKGNDVNNIKYKDSFGPALQLGADYALDKNWSLNVDLKKIWMSSDVKINGGNIKADVNVDPIVVGFGVGYRF